MKPEFNDTRELFDYVRKYDLEKIKSLDKIFAGYEFSEIEIQELLGEIIKSDNFLILDARSEKEFEESAIPYSINFPVLTNTERKNVGIIFNKYSALAAGELAVEFAEPKIEKLKKLLTDNNAGAKNIYIHCWRGGGRSKYLSKMVMDLGYKVKILKGGFKSYRRVVNEFFNQKEFPYELVELNGLTGVGKTEIINSLKNNYPVIDLERSARHFSSLFGFIPYKIRNYKPVANQSAFENDIFSQVILNKKIFGNVSTFLIESESKKVGDFYIPEILYEKLLKATCINIYINIEDRINRIINDYFGSDNIGIDEMLKILNEKERVFKKELSKVKFEELKSDLEKGDVYEFTKSMIQNYYDKKYKDKGKIQLATINNETLETAKEEIMEILKKLKNVHLTELCK